MVNRRKRWLSVALLLAAACSKEPNLVEQRAGLSAAPASMSFGDVAVGEHFVRRVEVENTGRAGRLVVEDVEVPAWFSVAPATFSIPSTGKTTVEVTFRPEAVGQAAGTIVFRASGAKAEVAVDGVGAARQVRMANGLDFGAVRVGAEKTLPLLVTSVATVPLDVSIDPPGDFTFAASPGSFRLEPGAEATVDVTFSPRARGPAQRPLSVRLCPGCDPLHVDLAGQGVDAVLTASPDPVGFEPVHLGFTRRQTVTLSNKGDLDLVLSSMRVEGDAFALLGGDLPFSLPVGAETTVDVSFTPLDEGELPGLLRVDWKPEGDESQSLLSVRLFGSTGGPYLVISPGRLDFEPLYVGMAPLRKTVTLTNVGEPAPLTLLSAAIEDDPTGAFRVEADSPSPLDPSATVTVVFDPGQAGSLLGRLVLRTDSPDQPELSTPLSGAATQPSTCALDVGTSLSSFDFHWVDSYDHERDLYNINVLTILCPAYSPKNPGPCGPCVFSNPRIEGPDARYFRLGRISEYDECFFCDPAPMPYVLYHGGGPVSSNPNLNLFAQIFMTPDTPQDVLLHANFRYELNGITQDFYLVGGSDPELGR